jgi:hypothetical protein
MIAERALHVLYKPFAMFQPPAAGLLPITLRQRNNERLLCMLPVYGRDILMRETESSIFEGEI